jgi:hypothetical protein
MDERHLTNTKDKTLDEHRCERELGANRELKAAK